MLKRALIRLCHILKLACFGFSLSCYGGQPFNDAMVLTSEIKGPQRGTIAGGLSDFEISATDIQASLGSFSIPLALPLPETRGPLIHDFRPVYSPSHGQSEWGMGFRSAISIYRYREEGALDFQTDTLMSPWGLLVRGESGFYYPKGLSKRIRVKLSTPRSESAKEIIAYLPDGSTLFFGGKNYISEVPNKGVYSWYLRDATTALGTHSAFLYESNSSGVLFLSEVLHAGYENRFQYRTVLQYEPLPVSTFSYSSGKRSEKDRRVKRVFSYSLSSSGSYSELYHFDLFYKEVPQTPKFYLTKIQRLFPSGEKEPSTRFQYDEDSNFLNAQWEHISSLDDLTGTAGAIFSPGFATQVDLDREGRTSFETREGFDLIHLLGNAFRIEKLQDRNENSGDISCRPLGDRKRSPRQFFAIRGPQAPYETISIVKSDLAQSSLIACDREGHFLGGSLLRGSWDLEKFSRLADLTHSGKPDLIKVFSGGYSVLPNKSTQDTPYQFGEERSGPLKPAVNPLGFWVVDMNGDGIPDLVVKSAGGFFIWYGKGNFEFENDAEFHYFYNSSNRAISGLENASVSFADLNHDGLMDVFLTSRTGIQYFLNTGKEFIEQEAPLLSARLGEIISYPIVADLKASGNTQLAIVQRGKAYSAELDRPSTGLMTSIDDGKGTLLSFSYKRAKSEPGIGQRIPLLDSVEIKSVGQENVNFKYDYKSPQFHSRLGHLLGYDGVSARGRKLETLSRFAHDDNHSGLLLETIQQDSSINVRKLLENNFEPASYDGLSIPLLTSKITSWIEKEQDPSHPSQVSLSQHYSNHDQNLCPKKQKQISSAGKLVTEKTYVALPDFESHLMCNEEGIRLKGKHSNRDFDFEYKLRINRNKNGQPTQISRLSENQTPITHEFHYSPFGEMISQKDPSEGQTEFLFDGAHRLTSVRSPNGVVNTQRFDGVQDFPLYLEINHGNSNSSHNRFFKFNELGFLVAQWDNLSGGSEDNPNASYRYHFADSKKGTLATIEQSTRVSLELNHSSQWKKDLEFFTGGGISVGRAHEGTGGWATSNLRLIQPTHNKISLLESSTLPSGLDFDDLTLESLLGRSSEIGSVKSSPIGLKYREELPIQKGLLRKRKFSFGLNQEGLVTQGIENSRFITSQTQDPEGNITSFTDEANLTYHYEYDSLNRLRRVTLPQQREGSSGVVAHTISYDSLGQVSMIVRDGVGSVGYQYESGSSLLQAKVYLDPQGNPIRKVSYKHDNLGRVVGTTFLNTSQRNTFPENYSFYYDGKVPNGPVIENQLGFLTGVKGPHFTKTNSFRPDGKLVEQRLNVSGWGTWTTSFEYAADGSVSRKLDQLQEKSNSRVEVNWDFFNNSFGDPGGFVVNSKLKSEYSYDSSTRIKEALFDFEKDRKKDLKLLRELHFSYDDWTNRKDGFSKQFDNTNSSFVVSWQLNDRNSIESEIVNDLKRSYDYSDPRNFLTRSSDSDQTESYGYDTIGLVSEVTSDKTSTDIKQKGNILKLGKKRFELDSFGRVSSSENGTFSYNGQGLVSEIFRSPRPKVEYGYDENGLRIFKKIDGIVKEVYLGDSIALGGSIFQPLRVAGMLVDFLDNGTPLNLNFDLRGSLASRGSSKVHLPSAYGERKDRTEFARIVDFASQRFDEDLGAYEMAHRDYDPVLKLFHTPDPLFLENPEKCVQSPHQCNLYGYANSNPASFVDPTGTDAIYIDFPDYKIQAFGQKIGNLGHAGVALIDNSTGLSKYYEFGRYDVENKGIVRQIGVHNVTIGSDGRPTAKSLNNLLHTISEKAGHGGRIEGAYIENDNFKAMDSYAQQQLKLNSNPDRKPYGLFSNNCGTFGKDVIKAGNVDTPYSIIPRPNSMVKDMQNSFEPIRYPGGSNGK